MISMPIEHHFILMITKLIILTMLLLTTSKLRLLRSFHEEHLVVVLSLCIIAEIIVHVLSHSCHVLILVSTLISSKFASHLHVVCVWSIVAFLPGTSLVVALAKGLWHPPTAITRY